MEFLQKKDLETKLFENYIDESEQEDMDALDEIELQGIAMIKSKLRKIYDVEIIFSNAVYPDRALIVWALTGIVVYRMIKRNAARKVPSDFDKDYIEVKEWLKGVQEGNETPDLPILEGSESKELYYGNSKNESLYF